MNSNKPKRGAPTGSRNAAKPVQRKSITIRLLPGVLTALDQLPGTRTANIEQAIKSYLAKSG